MSNITVDPKALLPEERPLFQASYGKLMMWFFLMSDAFTFSSLLIAYGALRIRSTSQGVPWADPEEVFTHAPILYEVFHISAPLVFVGLMTFILILSSVTMVLAVEAGHRRSQKEVATWMFWTIVGGFAFVSCQAYEWYHFIKGHDNGAFVVTDQVRNNLRADGHKMEDHTVLLVIEPGVTAIKNFQGEKLAVSKSSDFVEALVEAKEAARKKKHHLEAEEIISLANTYKETEILRVLEGSTTGPGGANMRVNEYGPPAFANLFFFVTGFHGTHVFSGVVINFIIYLNVLRGTYERRGHYEMVEKVGLYWHFVDLVWVFVFTFFYLV